jgi:uncharacterized protein with FMN-binding domain
MRRITLWLLSTVAVVVLLFSYKTSTMGPNGESGTPAAAPDANGARTAPDARASTSSATGTRQIDGSVARTRWGPVQVRITVGGGRITDVTAIQVPNGNVREQQINGYAVPILRQRTLAAQSAEIDTVSGATATSDGYRESLQAAIDAAHLR